MFWDERTRKSFGKAEREALYKTQKGKCMYCGRKLDKDLFHIDHKTAFARAGEIV